MGMKQSEKDAAADLSTTALTEKVTTSNAKCTHWKNEIIQMEKDEDFGVLGYIPIVAGIQALSGVSDELLAARDAKDYWCDRLSFYSDELKKRRAIAPEATAAAERKVYAEQTQVQEDVRARAKADAARDAPRTEFLGEKTAIGGPLAVVTGFPERIKEGFFGTFGLGSDQTAEERVAGLTRLLVGAVLLFAGYKVAALLAAGGAAMAERGAVRTSALATKVLDSPMPPGFL